MGLGVLRLGEDFLSTRLAADTIAEQLAANDVKTFGTAVLRYEVSTSLVQDVCISAYDDEGLFWRDCICAYSAGEYSNQTSWVTTYQRQLPPLELGNRYFEGIAGVEYGGPVCSGGISTSARIIIQGGIIVVLLVAIAYESRGGKVLETRD
jgi:hypothetical protein